MAEEKQQGNIRQEYNNATVGLNMDQSVNQIKPGTLTYALNAALENFDANSINYQNEPGNELCVNFPQGFTLIGTHFISEQSKHIFFITNSNLGESQIGYMGNNDCIYHILVNAACLNFNINYPIHKVVHRITNCSTEIYWTDGLNPRRYLDINNVPYILEPSSSLCDPIYTNQVDCNQLKIQPNFSIPQLSIADVITGGELKAGTVQFAIQYCDAAGNSFTSYYSVTNPTPIADPFITTVNYDYTVGKSVVVDITNLDITGQYQYYNLAVIKTVNAITSVELIGTYFIEQPNDQVIYTGQNVDTIRLTIFDIFEKYPYYDIAQDVTAVQDILVWDNLTSIDRLNYQSIASQIALGWQTYRIPNDENYTDELNATNLRGYLRDEVYAFEIVFLLKNGKQTDGFHIPGRMMNNNEVGLPLIADTDPDFIGEPTIIDPLTGIGYSPYWKIYNTASVTGVALGNNINNATPYQYGEFAYWESTEEYPCNIDVWGDLAGQPIRHHKFPDVLVSPIFENPVYVYSGTQVVPVMQNDAVYPIGVRVNVAQISMLIAQSSLTPEQKDDIVGFKIVRGDRGTNKSIIAKGILRNIGSYEREKQTLYYPNYPYNDLNEDPFLNTFNNAYSDISEAWLVIAETDGIYQYKDPNTNKTAEEEMKAGVTYEFCSTSRPVALQGTANIGPANFDSWFITGKYSCKGYRVNWVSPFSTINASVTEYNPWIDGYSNVFGGGWSSEQAITAVGGNIGDECDNSGFFNNVFTFNFACPCDSSINREPEVVQPAPVPGQPYSVNFNISRRSTLNCKGETPLPAFTGGDLNYRQIFNSPETSFGQPFLGDVLKLENVMFGAGRAHFVEVKSNAKYKLLTEEAQRDALESSERLGDITDPFNAGVMFAAYQAYLTIYINGITRKNYAYSFNSIANYDYFGNINNGLGIKQRTIDFARYLIPGVQSVGEPGGININNYERESSVYIKTIADRNSIPVTPLEFPSKTPSLVSGGTSIITDKSRFTIGSSKMCNAPAKEQSINVVSYYASMKNTFVNQWGQIYSYVTIDTGFQRKVDPTSSEIATVFGGDTFISRFTFKTKLPFFIDNRVNAPDDSDIFYDEIGNIAYPKYWHSARSILKDYTADGRLLSNIISFKAHKFDCPSNPSAPPPPNAGANRTFYDGYFYLFAYGVPNFYCESSYNIDLRQAFNNREGDFWPHVSTGIPDDWVQEDYVSIANDNTYTYNVTFSKQNKENTFTHLPADWAEQFCYTYYPFRAIYSDSQSVDADNRVNNWLTYRALSYFDFPQNYGNLISLDGIQNRAILARFENKTFMYNNLLTIDTSNPQAAYVGNPNMFSAPPIDFAETDLGYVGSQNKMLLKIPQGQVTVDAKRGQIFLISGTQAVDLSAFGSGMNRFFTDHLAFEILRYFPDVNVDNNFTGIGLHGVFDSKFDRIIITKLDYIPIDKDIRYDSILQQFYVEDVIEEIKVRTQVYLTDPDFFCNKSWTISFNFNTKSWVSFHSYIPNFYIGENNFFYSGINGCCDDTSFSAMVGNLIPATSTTTTTTAPLTTTTTTGIPPIVLDCDLEGIGEILVCDLEGNGIITVPSPSTTTTTTACSRPAGLNLYGFFTGYQVGSSPAIVSTGSLMDACAAIAFTNSTSVIMTGFSVNAENLFVGTEVYYETGTDCTLVPDGWYFTSEGQSEGFAYHLVGGIITEISSCQFGTTTTTSTLTPSVPTCCGILFNSGDDVYLLNNDGSLTILSVPTFSSSYGIAFSTNKLWSIDTNVSEWDITTTPFNAVFNRNITLPVGFTTGSGISPLSNTLLIAVDSSTSPQEVVELDITTTTAAMSTVFTLQTNRIALGNFLYTTSGKLLILNQDTITSAYYVTQYDYATFVIDLDIDLGAVVPTSIFECSCSIFIIDNAYNAYVIESAPLYTLLPVTTVGVIPSSAAQSNGCVICSLTDNGNLLTTTSTTLPINYFCYTVQVNNSCDVSWIDATGAPQTQSVSNDTIYVCAQQNSVTASCGIGASVQLSGGTNSCTNELDCQPPTTTSTTTIPPITTTTTTTSPP
jgi:hypothetical protein